MEEIVRNTAVSKKIFESTFKVAVDNNCNKLVIKFTQNSLNKLKLKVLLSISFKILGLNAEKKNFFWDF